jgi:hypothetical protein
VRTQRSKRRLHLSAPLRARLHRAIDFTLGGLMFLGAMAHGYGSLVAYPLGSEVLVWSLSGSGFAVLLAVLNLLRAGRPHDRTLAWICAGGCILWALAGIAFGAAIHAFFDPRVIFQVVVSAALADLSVRAAMGTDGADTAAEAAPSLKPAIAALDRSMEPPVPVSVQAPLPVRRPVSAELRVVKGGAANS